MNSLSVDAERQDFSAGAKKWQKHVWRPDFQMVFVPPPHSHISLVYVDKFVLKLPLKLFFSKHLFNLGLFCILDYL